MLLYYVSACAKVLFTSYILYWLFFTNYNISIAPTFCRQLRVLFYAVNLVPKHTIHRDNFWCQNLWPRSSFASGSLHFWKKSLNRSCKGFKLQSFAEKSPQRNFRCRGSRQEFVSWQLLTFANKTARVSFVKASRKRRVLKPASGLTPLSAVTSSLHIRSERFSFIEDYRKILSSKLNLKEQIFGLLFPICTLVMNIL